ncbi:MAG: SH3 domain-containing protein [Mycobacteriales bacterium]|jgi:hypothetical protein
MMKCLRLVLLLLLIAAPLSVGPLAGPAHSVPTRQSRQDICQVVVIADGLRLRAAPDSSSTALDQVPMDTVLDSPSCTLTTSGGDYTDCSAGASANLWAAVVYNNLSGWIAADCVEAYG